MRKARSIVDLGSALRTARDMPALAAACRHGFARMRSSLRGSAQARLAMLVAPFLLVLALTLLWTCAPFCAEHAAYALDGGATVVEGEAAEADDGLATADEGVAATSVSADVTEFDYDGADITFFERDGSRFGMYERQDGSSIEYKDGKIVVEYVTKNTTIYAGFYLEANKDDSSTWDESKFYPRNSNGWLSFTLDPSYAGKAWPIAPVKVSDMTASTGGQYYLAVPALEKIPGYLLTVTFTDGMGNVISTDKVVSGSDAVPPESSELPERKGFTFQDWDTPYTDITEDTTINAVWLKDDATYYVVDFVDGWGNTLVSRKVEEGGEALAPDAPMRDGYVFAGWNPATFDNITENLVVEAMWVKDEDAALVAARDAIAALPSDPKEVLGDLENETVATAVAVYDALTDGQRAQLIDDERLLLAKCAIAILPSDAFDITAEHESAIKTAEGLYGALTQEQQSALDDEAISSSRSYGRYLENVAWALDSLTPVDNATPLQAGTYTGKVKSASSMGKSNSRRALTFSVTSVTVADGKAIAVIEHSSNSSQSLRLGGMEYQNLQTDASQHSYFEIPINLNSTFHFSIKGKSATEDTDAISYEMTVAADESAMKPDQSGGGGKPVDPRPSDPDPAKPSGGSPQPVTPGSTPVVKDSYTGVIVGSSGSGDGVEVSNSDELRKPTVDPKAGKSPSSSNPSGASPSPSGSPASGSGSGSTAARSSTKTSGTAGNLSSLASNNRQSSASASKSAASASSGASASKTDAGSASTQNGAGGGSAGGDGGTASATSVREIALSAPDDIASASVSPNLAPAIAGGALLAASLGVFAFVLRFVRRESAFA